VRALPSFPLNRSGFSRHGIEHITQDADAARVCRDIAALVATLGGLLLRRGHMLVTAESCTGGLLGAAITDAAGSSLWYERGFITYSNAAKMAHLNVSDQTLARHGAVSESTAMEMAAGALASAPAGHLALSTTGIAGPGGATPDKPVGMVCFGVAQRHADGVVVRADTQVFAGDRGQVRAAAVAFALQRAIGCLTK